MWHLTHPLPCPCGNDADHAVRPPNLPHWPGEATLGRAAVELFKKEHHRRPNWVELMNTLEAIVGDHEVAATVLRNAVAWQAITARPTYTWPAETYDVGPYKVPQLLLAA